MRILNTKNNLLMSSEDISRNLELLKEYMREFDKATGPRIGDYLKLPDNTYLRFTADWDESIQTTCRSENLRGNASFNIHRGSVSFSGSLDPAIPKDSIVSTNETKEGSVWFFKDGLSGAFRGVNALVTLRVFELKEELKS